MKDASRYRSREWYRQRIRTLDERNCTTAAQLQATLDELVTLSVGEMRAMIARNIFDGFERLVQATPTQGALGLGGKSVLTQASLTMFLRL